MNRKQISHVLTAIAASLASTIPAPAQECPAGALATPKASALYLYYAPSSDSTFPDWLSSMGVHASPVAPFDVADLDPGVGSAAALLLRTEQLLEAGYCEFDVDVRTVTSAPAPSEPRWQIIGIGSDTNGKGLSGQAQKHDTGDADAQDYARFYVGQMGVWAGAQLTGANSTPERWATALADLIGHESGHNYGLTHADCLSKPGEDAQVNHFIADPAYGATPASIVDALNHFGDAEYEILGHNIGLNAKTVHNWDFVNPNGSSADSLVITLLSNAPTLTIAWWYNGTLSPWSDPTVADTGTTEALRGTTYKKYELTFATGKSWSGGAAGIAPAGVKLHVGASFTAADPLFVVEATLESGGSELPLHPRMFDYDAGSSFAGFGVEFGNPDPGAGFLELRDLDVVYSPRMIDIETMIAGATPRGLDGWPVATYERPRGGCAGMEIVSRRELRRRTFQIGAQPLFIPLAELTDPRHIDITYGPEDCDPARGDAGGVGFGPPGAVVYCPKGTSLSLFPATYVYISATVVDPRARHWDAAQSGFVEGPVESRLFFQVAGIVPDANRNGEDDLLDIRSGSSVDRNGNGIPDEAQKRRWWCWKKRPPAEYPRRDRSVSYQRPRGYERPPPG